MSLQILHKNLDASRLCPLCNAAMYWVEAEQYEQELHFHQCSYCQHRLFIEQKHTCHCEYCAAQRKRLVAETRQQEKLKFQSRKQKDRAHLELGQLSLVHKLFLLSVLDQYVDESTQYDEFIHWDKIKFQSISPNFLFQQYLVKQLLNEQILIPTEEDSEQEKYFIQVRLDGYTDPSLFRITQQLRHWFLHNLSLGTPFKSAQEVKDCLYLLLYQEIIQFMQFYCRAWQIQISGNLQFQQFCYRLLDQLAVGQIYYLIQTALEYLHDQQALKTRNDQFINTNFLRKTLERYRLRAVSEHWETLTLPRPHMLPLSKMSEFFFYRFLGYNEDIFLHPVRHAWHKIEPRLTFYSEKRCMYCGSHDLIVDYDAHDYVSLQCRQCKHQDHYFTQ